MLRASTHTNFHSSNLIRVLSELALVESCEPGNAFAEKLGQWLNLVDAINLHAVLASGTKPPLAQSGSIEKMNLNDEFARLRASLVKLDLSAGLTKSSGIRSAMPHMHSDLPLAVEATYEPYRRSYLAHQRTMETKIRSFRLQMREVLAKTSPALAKLAALDAVFEQSLSERERQLLSTLPSLLAKRFEQLRKTDPHSLAGTRDAVGSVSPVKSSAWLTRFCQELQAVLLAELDTRLEPTLGLIEAFNLETTKHS
jgi:hypothetical protein